MKIKYITGFKHMLAAPYLSDPMPALDRRIQNYYAMYTWEPRMIDNTQSNARLHIPAGFGWDGVTWFPDFKCLQRAGLVHDALYWLIRRGGLNEDAWKAADAQFKRIAIEDGTWPWVANLLVKVLKLLKGEASNPKNVKKVLVAP